MKNEEQILLYLERLISSVHEIRCVLDEHGKMLEEQGKMLEEHGERLEELEERTLRTAVTLEGYVMPKLQVLTEGQEMLVQSFEDLKDQKQQEAEAVDQDVSVLKDVVGKTVRRTTVLEEDTAALKDISLDLQEVSEITLERVAALERAAL